jgi:NAD(P)-dependent dehydrogenase (short-subunit alcohol dehydrogenase family)
MNIVAADVQGDALQRAEQELTTLGATVLPYRLDVSSALEVEQMGAATLERFGVPHLVFNNAGVGAGGLIWEHTLADWEWVIGVNLMGVAHGVRVFTPLMLEAAERDPGYEGHVINTASMAGLVNPPNMGVYNVSKHAVVSMSETLYQDLALVGDQVHAHVLCPFFVATGIGQSGRNRPKELSNPSSKPTPSQLIAQAMTNKAVGSGKVTAAMVAQFVIDAVRDNRFYIYSHPKALGSVQTRLEDVMQQRNPSDPLKDVPEMGAQLRAALRAR